MENAGIVPGGLSGVARSAREFEWDGRGVVERPFTVAGTGCTAISPAGSTAGPQSARGRSNGNFVFLPAHDGPVGTGKAIERRERATVGAGQQKPGGGDVASRSRAFPGIQLFGAA